MGMVVAAFAFATGCSLSPPPRVDESPDVSAKVSEPPVAVTAGDSSTSDERASESAGSDAAGNVRLELCVESQFASARAPGSDPRVPQQVTVFPGTVCVQVVVSAVVGIDDRASFSPAPPAIAILTADGEPHAQLTADVRVEPVVGFDGVVDGGDPEVTRVALHASFGVEIAGFDPLATPERVQLRATYHGFETTLWVVLVPMFSAERR